MVVVGVGGSGYGMVRSRRVSRSRSLAVGAKNVARICENGMMIDER